MLYLRIEFAYVYQIAIKIIYNCNKGEKQKIRSKRNVVMFGNANNRLFCKKKIAILILIRKGELLWGRNHLEN